MVALLHTYVLRRGRYPGPRARLRGPLGGPNANGRLRLEDAVPTGARAAELVALEERRIELKTLYAMHVQGVYSAMLDRGLSPRPVQYTHAVLRRALKQAVLWGVIPRNVCEDADLPRLRPEEVQPLDRAQSRHLLRPPPSRRTASRPSCTFWPYTLGCGPASCSV